MYQLHTDIVDTDQGRVGVGYGVNGNLEFTRQVGEFRIEGGPLADDFAPGAWVFNLFGINASKFVGGDITDAVTTGLNGMHLYVGQFRQDVRHFLNGRPVQLNVLAGADMTETLVIGPHDMRQTTQLTTRQQAIRNGNTQHGRITLNVEAVLQAKGEKLVFAELIGEKTAGLVAILRHPLFQQPLIVFLIDVHGTVSPSLNA